MKKVLLVLFFLLISVLGYAQCPYSVTIKASNTTICSGNSVVLTAEVTGASAAATYVWNTGETTQTINTNKPGTYTVSITDGGCTESASQVLTAAGIPDAPSVAKTVEIACPGTSATLQATGPGGTYYWYTDNGTFKASGASFVTDPIFVKTIYLVETVLNGCTSGRTMVTVYPISGPTGIGASTCRGGAVTLTASGAGEYFWYNNSSATGTPLSTTSTLNIPSLTATTTYYVVGRTNGCTSTPTPVQAIVNEEPPPPVPNNPSVCAGNYTILHATSTVPNATFKWYRDSGGTQLLIASSDYTTEVLNSSVTYYVRAISPGGCEGPLAPATVTVNPIPGAPAYGVAPICSVNTATININNPSGTYNWYSSSTSPVVLASSPTFTTPVLTQNTTFYVEWISASGCSSGIRTAVPVTVHPTPVAPIFAGPYEVCSGGTITVTPLGPGGTYNWYTSATATTPVFTGTAGYTITGLTATTNYFVEAVNADGCASPTRRQVTVIVNPTPALPTVSGSTIICSNDRVVLSAGGSGSGVTYEWFDQVNGPVIATGATYTSPVLTANVTYYVRASNSTCSSALRPIPITVNSLPQAPTTTNITVCAGTTPTISASNVGPGTIRWYNNAFGGPLLGSGSNYTLPSPIAATQTFYAEVYNGTCSSTRTPLVVTVTSTTNQFQYASGTFCQASANPTPQINVPGGTFSAPAGMVINATTGEINLAASTLGSYTVTYNNACAISTNQISIVTSPDAAFSYSATNYCQGDNTDRAPIFANPTTGTAGVFSATPAGLRFTNVNSGIIDVSNSLPGTYTVINTIDAAGGCATVVSAPVTVTIDSRVIVNAGPNQNAALNTPVQLNGSITGGVTTGTWTGGGGSFNNANNLNAIYTPLAGETSVTLTLTSADPGTTCGPIARSMTISFSPKPLPPPVMAVAQPICAGSAVTLSVQPPYTDVYRWYAASAGGPVLHEGENYSIASILSTTTYHVEHVVNGVASDRTPVLVTVIAIPLAPAVVSAIDSVCLGDAPIFAVNSPNAASTYRWYETATSTAVQVVGASFTPPVPAGNTSYWVEEDANGCPGPRTRVDVIVKPVPNVTNVPSPDAICSGTLFNYNLTADLPGTNFIWSRAFNPDIQAPAVTDTSARISETLINTSDVNQTVTYTIRPVLNGCIGAPFTHPVIVYPTARVTSAAIDTVCSAFALNYEIKFNTGVQFTWRRDALGGNPAVSGQASNFINEALENNTNAPFTVDYFIDYKTATCPGGSFNFKVLVYPRVQITSKKTDTICAGVPQNYRIRSNIPGAVYSWSRAVQPGISNPGVVGHQSDIIDEVLTNTAGGIVPVEYLITTVDGGCQPNVFSYVVSVKPQPPLPAPQSEPACVGDPLKLFYGSNTPGANFSWRGPNGFTSTQRDPVINNATTANSGRYFLTVTVDNCASVEGYRDVDVIERAVVDAGPVDTTVCRSVTRIPVSGRVISGSGTTTWSTSGKGHFEFPIYQLSNNYIPDVADINAGSVTLTLTSRNVALCENTDNILVKFDKVPASNAGRDTSVCEQATTIALNGRMLVAVNGTWSTSGKGSFSPSAAQAFGGASPNYIPHPDDIAAGSVKLTLTANTTDDCYIPADEVIITFAPPPTVNAGGLRYVLENKTITLTPIVSDENVTYSWTLADGSPATGLSADNIKNPIVTGTADITYRLTITDSRGCTNSSNVLVKVATEVIAPNTFTPNADGVNDTWEVKGLVAYEDAVIDVFNRYGQKVYTSIGYSKPWDGTQNGKPVPVGTYYYVINTHVFDMKYSGYVAVIR